LIFIKSTRHSGGANVVADGTRELDRIERTGDSGMGLGVADNRISICTKIVKRKRVIPGS
jgi:hypothetical protein